MGQRAGHVMVLNLHIFPFPKMIFYRVGLYLTLGFTKMFSIETPLEKIPTNEIAQNLYARKFRE
jgi:hypothetical protein